MEDKREQRLAEKKRPYAKPAVRQVKLTPEEAVLGNCKMTGNTGPLTSNCSPPACFTIGT